MRKIGEFMGVPVFASPAVPKNEVFILNTDDLKGPTGIRIKHRKNINWGNVAFAAFMILGLIATHCLFMYALVWSW